jgi:hypothetical protein
LFTAVYTAVADAHFFTEVSHQTIRVEKLLGIAKTEAVVLHVIEREGRSVECRVAEKAFGSGDFMAVFGIKLWLCLFCGGFGWCRRCLLGRFGFLELNIFGFGEDGLTPGMENQIGPMEIGFVMGKKGVPGIKVNVALRTDALHETGG